MTNASIPTGTGEVTTGLASGPGGLTASQTWARSLFPAPHMPSAQCGGCDDALGLNSILCQ